jgi:hypothetical protein
MITPEGKRGEGIGNKNRIENESAEVWNNAAKELSGIYFFSLCIIKKAKLEGM